MKQNNIDYNSNDKEDDNTKIRAKTLRQENNLMMRNNYGYTYTMNNKVFK